MLTDEQRADGWIEHDGGPCPVPPSSRPGVMFGDGYTISPHRCLALGFTLWPESWNWAGSSPATADQNIIAYRPETPDAQ